MQSIQKHCSQNWRQWLPMYCWVTINLQCCVLSLPPLWLHPVYVLMHGASATSPHGRFTWEWARPAPPPCIAPHWASLFPATGEGQQPWRRAVEAPPLYLYRVALQLSLIKLRHWVTELDSHLGCHTPLLGNLGRDSGSRTQQRLTCCLWQSESVGGSHPKGAKLWKSRDGGK